MDIWCFHLHKIGIVAHSASSTSIVSHGQTPALHQGTGPTRLLVGIRSAV